MNAGIKVFEIPPQINIANTSIELSKHNIYRIGRILFPPNPEVLANMCRQGFDDALRFLHRNNLISCTRCLAVQSTFVVSETVEENHEYDPQCHECNKHRQVGIGKVTGTAPQVGRQSSD